MFIFICGHVLDKPSPLPSDWVELNVVPEKGEIPVKCKDCHAQMIDAHKNDKEVQKAINRRNEEILKLAKNPDNRGNPNAQKYLKDLIDSKVMIRMHQEQKHQEMVAEFQLRWGELPQCELSN